MESTLYLVKEYILFKVHRSITRDKYFSSWEKMSSAFKKYFSYEKEINFFECVKLRQIKENIWYFHMEETEERYECEYEIIQLPIDEEFDV